MALRDLVHRDDDGEPAETGLLLLDERGELLVALRDDAGAGESGGLSQGRDRAFEDFGVDAHAPLLPRKRMASAAPRAAWACISPSVGRSERSCGILARVRRR